MADFDSAESVQADADLAGAWRAQAAASRLIGLRQPSTECCAPPSIRAGFGRDRDMAEQALVYIVDHDAQVRAALRRLLEGYGLRTETFADGAAFLGAYRRRDNVCLLADTALTDLKGLTLLRALGASAEPLPVIMITDSSDVAMAVDAMEAGAVGLIEKPIGGAELIASVMRALAGGVAAADRAGDRSAALHHFEGLTGRQRQIMALVLAGQPSKNIAADLGISRRTVENHRAAIMRKSGSKSLPALARLALAAGESLAN
jgi:two-component system CheB/CheR fusion protein